MFNKWDFPHTCTEEFDYHDVSYQHKYWTLTWNDTKIKFLRNVTSQSGSNNQREFVQKAQMYKLIYHSD